MAAFKLPFLHWVEKIPEKVSSLKWACLIRSSKPRPPLQNSKRSLNGFTPHGGQPEGSREWLNVWGTTGMWWELNPSDLIVFWREDRQTAEIQEENVDTSASPARYLIGTFYFFIFSMSHSNEPSHERWPSEAFLKALTKKMVQYSTLQLHCARAGHLVVNKRKCNEDVLSVHRLFGTGFAFHLHVRQHGSKIVFYPRTSLNSSSPKIKSRCHPLWMSHVMWPNHSSAQWFGWFASWATAHVGSVGCQRTISSPRVLPVMDLCSYRLISFLVPT